MTIDFLYHMRIIEDHRIPGMTTYPLDEVLFSVLAGLLCRAEDWEEIEFICREELEWLRMFLPFRDGIPQAQTYRRIFRHLDPDALEHAFAGWAASMQAHISGVVAVDGKTARGSKKAANGEQALHVLSAYAHDAGLVIGQRMVDAKSNEITAIPELLSYLALEGAIVTIDAMGCQKKIVNLIAAAKADYVLALKGNQGALKEDADAWFADPDLKNECAVHTTTGAGHGRIEERICRVAPADWLARRHEGWTGLVSIVQVATSRTDKKTGQTACETRLYISSLPPDDPEQILDAVRSHWSIENNLHWQLDLTFREDENRTRTGHAARNLALLRRCAFNILKREPSTLPLKRKRLKAALNNEFRTRLLQC